ncbi:MAG: hypothetical protein C5B49_00965 [Bdellovibrio sp.]|nr:MAG: hypothetical protein C5B49_00965 [Bdellovibrio sp.]
MSPFSLRVMSLQFVLAILCCGFQTTVWPNLFGSIQMPQFWLPWILFLSLHRPYFEALFMSYFFALIMLSFTSLSLQMIWPTFLVLVSAAAFAKNKFFWPGLRYFIPATGLCCLLWNVTLVGLSSTFEKSSAPLLPITRVLEALLTTLASPLIYGALIRLEKLRPVDSAKATVREVSA